MFSHFPSVDKQNMFFSAPPYLFTNEEGTAKTIDTLSHLPKRKGKRLHIGVSGFFNYDIVAARKSHGVVLWDINTEVQKLHELVKNALLISPTPQTFIVNWTQITKSLVDADFFSRNRKNVSQTLYEEASQTTSWLAKEDTYQYIRSLYQKNCVHICFGNWLDKPLIVRTARWVQKNSWVLDTVYLSNCGDQNWKRMSNSLLGSARLSFPEQLSLKTRIVPLLQTGTYVIEASAQEDLNQRICRIQKLQNQGIRVHPVFTHQRPLHERSLLCLSKHPHKTTLCLFLISALFVYQWLQLLSSKPDLYTLPAE